MFVTSGDGNAIPGNSIWQNGATGIDLDPYGNAQNDPADVDLGPNRNLNYPVLKSVVATASSATFDGVLWSSPRSMYTVELFSSPGTRTASERARRWSAASRW